MNKILETVKKLRLKEKEYKIPLQKNKLRNNDQIKNRKGFKKTKNGSKKHKGQR